VTIRGLIGRARGHYYRQRHRGRLVLGSGVQFACPAKFSGAGSIVIGDGVRFDNASGVRPNIRAAAGATVTIGAETYFNGAGIWATRDVEIGAGCILGETWVTTTNFHSTGRERGANVKQAPVHVGENVWLANRTVLLPGSTVGDHATVGIGVVVSGEVPADAVVVPGAPRVIE
jgi:UDP-3-O-[3-hydroxymyristoyl] glucosamine N-acyltransferase